MKAVTTIIILAAVTIYGCNNQPAAVPSVPSVNLEIGDSLPVYCAGSISIELGSPNTVRCEQAQTPTAVPVVTFVPTDMPTATATSISVPVVTIATTPTRIQTATPTASPTVTSTQTGQVGREQWQLCDTHDPTQWHAMDDLTKQCHYDHTHGDDPNSALALKWFKPISATISYPWQTFKMNADGSQLMENEFKHSGYIWLVRQLVEIDQNGVISEVANDLNWVGRTPSVVVAVRMQVHRHPTLDSKVQKHSYWMETYDCKLNADRTINWSNCGTSSTGGVSHFGIMHCAYKEVYCQLSTDESVPPNQWLPGLSTSTDGKIIDPYRATNKPCSTSTKTGVLDRLGTLSDGWWRSGTYYDDNNRDNWSLWTTAPGVYGVAQGSQGYNWLMGMAILSTDDPDCNDLDAYRNAQSLEDATEVVNKRICDSAPANVICRFDGSEHAVFTAYSYTPSSWDNKAGLDTDPAVGYVTMKGFTDTRGNLVANCATSGANCVPIYKNHSPVGWSGWNAAQSRNPNGKSTENLLDYNTSPNGKQWVAIGETVMHNH